MPLADLTYSTYPHGTPLFASGRRCVNVYAEKAEGQAKQPFMLMSAPGMKLWATPTGTTGLEVRGFHKFADTTYVVIGSFLFSLASGGTATQVGSGIAGTGPVRFASDNDQMVIVTRPGTDDYLYTTAGGLSQLTGSNIVDWRDVAFLDGRAVFVQNSPAIAGRFSFTDVNALATIGASSFGNAESSADSLLRILEVDRLLWMLGPDTAEPFAATGDSTTPFARHSDSIEPYGIVAEDSGAVLNDKGFYLAGSKNARPHARMISGAGSVRISTNAIEDVIEGGTYSDAIGFTYAQRGHEFYSLTFPTLGRCFVYDASTNFWHERQSGVSIVAGWDARHSIVFDDTVIVGHKDDGKLYELDFDTHTDASAARMRLFTAVLPMSGEFWNRISGIMAEMRTGVGASGATVEPQVMMDISRDGGETFGNERWRGLGFSGQRKKRSPTWMGCGRGRAGVIARFRVTDAVPVEVTAVHAWGRPGRR